MSGRGEEQEGVRLTVLGSGDAFNSGARFNAAYLVQAQGSSFMIDCGPTSLMALKSHGVDPGCVDFVLVSHLHGDHFAGLPSLLLEYTFEKPRDRPLLVAGPPGIEERVRSLFSTCYREVASRAPPFALQFRELLSDCPVSIGAVDCLPFEVPHQSLDLSLGFRVALGGKQILYSGDSGWSERFVELSRGVDLFVCECTYYQTSFDFHIDYAVFEKQLSRLGPKRLLLTHLGSEMLSALQRVSVECAHDGLVIRL